MASIFDFLRSFQDQDFNRNVFIPQGDEGFFGRHPRLSRGLDNALLSAATFGPSGNTVGENIGAVARNILGLGPARQQLNMERALAPLMASRPALDTAKILADIQYQADLGKQARALSEARGRQNLYPDRYEAERVDKEGRSWGLSKETGQWEQLKGPSFEASAPKGLKTVEERFLSGEMLNNVNTALQSFGMPTLTQEDLRKQLLAFYGVRAATTAGQSAGAATGARIGATPGYVPEDVRRGLDIIADQQKAILAKDDYDAAFGYDPAKARSEKAKAKAILDNISGYYLGGPNLPEMPGVAPPSAVPGGGGASVGDALSSMIQQMMGEQAVRESIPHLVPTKPTQPTPPPPTGEEAFGNPPPEVRGIPLPEIGRHEAEMDPFERLFYADLPSKTGAVTNPFSFPGSSAPLPELRRRPRKKRRYDTRRK